MRVRLLCSGDVCANPTFSATGVFYARRSSFLDADKEFNIQAVDLQHPIIDLAEVSGKYVATLDTSRGANDAVAVLTLNSDGEVSKNSSNDSD